MKKLKSFIIGFALCAALTGCAVGAAIGKNVTAHVQQNDSVTTVVHLNQNPQP